jgi:hypothetical protein
MLLSALHKQINSASQDILEYQVFLASPDSVEGDDIDVFLIGIGEVDVDPEKHEIRLIPRSSDEPSRTEVPILLLSILLEQLPVDAVQGGDFELLAELPLARDSGHPVPRSLVSITSLHVGQESAEAWFLVRPASEYANNALPS